MPEVIHEHEVSSGSSALGVIVGALIVILILLAIWWFGFGPAHTSTAPGAAPAASAPAITIPSVPAGGSPGASASK